MRKFSRAMPVLLIVAMFFACQKASPEKKISILVNHDRWGEVAPCG